MPLAPGARRRLRPSLFAAILAAVLAVSWWRFTQPAPSHELRLTQLTFDPGLAAWPAVSPDGRTVAYVSDREGGHLDLYVQAVQGGSPVRLTTGDDASEPAFSSDGSSLAYRSSKEGGGIYVIPAAGGDARLLAAGGRRPRYSPDGRWIAFRRDDAIYVAASPGGAARPFHPELSAPRAPSWSPDSRSLLWWAAQDWRVAPLAGGAPQSTGLAARLAQAGLGSGPFDDALWTAAGFLFSARTGVVRNLYLCPLDAHGKAAGEVVRLTNGTEIVGDASASRGGRVVFAAGRQRFDIWGLPLNGNRGQATGAPYRITDSLAPTASPDLSPDGRKLLFGSSRNGFTQVWEKDLVSGKESVAATGPEGASSARWLKRSARIVYMQPAGGRNDVYLQDRRLASGARPWDTDSKEETLLLGGPGIDALDLASGQRRPLLRAPQGTSLSHASFSPDDRWILFLAETVPAARIYVAPAQGGPWLPVTDGAAPAGTPRFSPDGRLVYFTLDRGGARTIQAVRFDPRSGQPLGQPFSVFAPRSPRLSLLLVSPQALQIAVARDKLVTILCESASTIWMGDPVLH
jgi:Tol biopolymer transport system component